MIFSPCGGGMASMLPRRRLQRAEFYQVKRGLTFSTDYPSSWDEEPCSGRLHTLADTLGFSVGTMNPCCSTQGMRMQPLTAAECVAQSGVRNAEDALRTATHANLVQGKETKVGICVASLVVCCIT